MSLLTEKIVLAPLKPAWFSRQITRETRLRVWLRGWFSPLHGTVTAVDGVQACIGGKWVTLSGKKADVVSVEILS